MSTSETMAPATQPVAQPVQPATPQPVTSAAPPPAQAPTPQPARPVAPLRVAPTHLGLDVGTMNLVCARANTLGKIEIASLRNVFLTVEDVHIEGMDLSKISHARIDDGVFILSHDAYNFANIFGYRLSRSMQKGMISPEDINSTDILAVMIRELLALEPGAKPGKCVYSVPGDPVNSKSNVLYHRNILGRIINEIGFEAEPLNEATAIIYAECADSDFSGISISFGAGLTNVAVVYKSIPVLEFALGRGGDWIDDNVAMAVGTIPNRVVAIKEKDFHLDRFDMGRKKERKVREALGFYYKNLIQYVVKSALQELDRRDLDLGFPNRIPMIISGGTSLAGGFLDYIRAQVEEVAWPLELSEVRYAGDPLSCVAQGCLIKSLKQ
ncbi:MAG: hypothetical protein HQM01_04930 [Magnetococcales bacterium]|nr:hypothetical protein [Magnetococcales bacterium]